MPDLLSHLRASGFFLDWTDPVSGVGSLILRPNLLAPLQQSFYFTNPSFSADARYYWFYVAFPPSGSANSGRLLARLDLLAKDARYFPETAFLDASPMIDPRTGDAYWCSGLEIFRRPPHPDAPVTLLHRFPAELAKNRRPYRLATHLTFSADRSALNIDAQIGNDWYIGDVPLTGEFPAPFRLWQHFPRCYNHAQFSPTDPDLQLVAQDWWHDPATGAAGKIDNRIWLIRRGQSAEPLLPDGSARHTHEWWDASGQSIWFVDYDRGTCRTDLASRHTEILWPHGTCHAHADATGNLLVGDIGTYSWERGCRVAFFHRPTNRETNIVSSLPVPPFGGRSHYHIDPHPQFCLSDQLIAYTTTVLGNPTPAFVDTAQLLAQIAR